MGKQIAVFANKRLMALMVACASFVLLFLITRVAILNSELGLLDLSHQAATQITENDEDAVFLEMSRLQGDDTPIHYEHYCIQQLSAEQATPQINTNAALSTVIQQAPSRASPVIS